MFIFFLLPTDQGLWEHFLQDSFLHKDRIIKSQLLHLEAQEINTEKTFVKKKLLIEVKKYKNFLLHYYF